jgi:hypothetical protein
MAIESLDEAAGREHAPGRLHSAELDIEGDEPRTIHRGARHDPLALELSRASMQLLEPSSTCRLAVRRFRGGPSMIVAWRCPGTRGSEQPPLHRAVGRHVAPIRGEPPERSRRVP